MKYLLTIIALAGAFTCSSQAQCPIPVGFNGSNGIGPNIPGFYDMMDNLSPNGKMLSYLDQDGDNGAHLLNLETLADTLIQVHGGLPGEQDIFWNGVAWCPYDSDLVALNVISFIDTTNMGVSTVYVENAFLYRISTGESQIIRPNVDYIYGSTGIYSWLPGSKQGMDSILIGFGYGSGSPGFHGVYVPQTQTLIPTPISTDNAIYSPNHEDSLTGYSLNGHRIVFPQGIDTSDPGIQWTFSPDSKLLAFEITPYNADADSIFDQVWVYNVSDPTKCIDQINFQQLYCKYSLDGIWPEFITDSTLAVSMYTDGDIFSPLWEITIDGRIVRQLTFLPHARLGVEASSALPSNSFSLHSYPNPFTQSTTITFSSQDEGYADVTVVNLLGMQVAQVFSGEIASGEHEFSWDAIGMPPGMYECIVRINGSIQHVPVILSR